MRKEIALSLSMLALALAGCGVLPGSGPKRDGPSTTMPRGVPGPSVTGAQCLAKLEATGTPFSALPDRYEAPGCFQINPVQVAALPGDTGSIAATNLGPMTCETANTFAGWARFGVDRAARQILGSALVRIETMGTYNCRNVAGTSRRSAHARAEAVDVSAFILADGRRISLIEDWHGGTAQEREFLRAVHRSACRRFATVLSPDYDAAHADHFHMEIGQGSFCR